MDQVGAKFYVGVSAFVKVQLKVIISHMNEYDKIYDKISLLF